MINALSRLFTNICQRYLPDAYVFSLILTLLVFIFGLSFTDHSALEMINFWGDGFWNLMKFTMQMTMILITGFTLAKTKAVNSVLIYLTRFAKGPVSAILMAVIVSSSACYINWGFGLIVSALFALELAKKIKNLNFPLLIAASYSGFLVWHGGLSGSIPLKLTDPSHTIKSIIGRDSIPLSETINSPLNIVMLLGTVLILLIICYLLAKDKSQHKLHVVHTHNTEKETPTENTVASKLEHSKVLNLIIATMGLFYIFNQLALGKSFGLNLMIFLFLILAMLFSYTPIRFINSFHHSVKDSSGILLQFPFYAGIMGMMSGSGLATEVSQFFVDVSEKQTFLVFTYWSAGLINFFIPSGGGQWAIQGAIILPAAKELGVDLAKASMAIAWGDAWTNMIQPFWAIPLLSIAKLNLKDIMGYSVIIFIFTGLFSSMVFVIMN